MSVAAFGDLDVCEARQVMLKTMQATLVGQT
jgi:hypothetical protein